MDVRRRPQVSLLTDLENLCQLKQLILKVGSLAQLLLTKAAGFTD